MLPEQVSPVWYWVDTNDNLKYLNESDMPEAAHYVYGFDAQKGILSMVMEQRKILYLP